MSKLRTIELFAGIGGFSRGLEATGGFEVAAHCEIDPYCQRVLAKHWPGGPCYHDVRELTAARLAADGVTGIQAITGGFPCQDISLAGAGAGLDGERSGLWSEIVRLVGELRPEYVIVENVAALLAGPSERRGGWFGRVLGDLAECGYDAEWRNIPAWFVGLPHNRQRVWIVAYPQQDRWPGILPSFASERDAAEFRRNQASIALAASRRLEAIAAGDLDGQSPFCDDADGLPDLVAGLGAAGNAVVPQIPELIGRAILRAEQWGGSC